MTALIVIGAILVFFALLFSFSVTLYVRWTDALRLKVGIFGLRFDVMSPEKDEKDALREKQSRPKRVHAKKKSSSQKKKKPSPDTKKEVHSFSETVELVLGLIRSVFSPVTFILRHLRITDLSVWVKVGQEDADQTALTYAGIGIAVHDTVAFLKSLIPVQIKKIEIVPDFVSGETVQDVSFRVKLRLGIIIAGLLGMLFYVIKDLLSHKWKEENDREIKKEGVSYE